MNYKGYNYEAQPENAEFSCVGCVFVHVVRKIVNSGLKTKPIYKEVDGELEECTVKEILERNIEGTTIKKCKVDVFFTGNLQ